MNGSYFYLASRAENDKDLVAAEMTAFVGVSPNENSIAISERRSDIAASAFIKFGAELVLTGGSLNEVVDQIRARSIKADSFRVVVEKLSPNLEVESPDVAAAIGSALIGRPDLSSPRTKLLVSIEEDRVLFGRIFSEYSRAWIRMSRKPHTTSSSIPHRLARAMVNLAGVRPPATMIDPCCGAGTILLEAAEMGYAVTGVDINYRMYQASRKNLLHFGLDGRVYQDDSRSIEGCYDLLVTDMPYGMNTVADDKLYRELTGNFVKLAPVAVIVTAKDIRDTLLESGYTTVKRVDAPKHSMVRQIFVCER